MPHRKHIFLCFVMLATCVVQPTFGSVRQDVLEIETRTESTFDTPGTFSPTQSFGIEVEYKRVWVNALTGPNDLVDEPCTGYGVSMFGGYATMGDGVPFDNGRIVINDIIRSGLSFMLFHSSSTDFSQEKWAWDLAVKWGVALSEREEREAIDIVGITRQGYWFVAPAATVSTPVRFHSKGLSAVLVAGAEAGFYRLGNDGFNTIGLNLGFQFLFR